jgi:hypothetical protein
LIWKIPVVSAISGSSPLIPASSVDTSPTAAADKVVNLLLHSEAVLQSLASQSSFYLPPQLSQVLSTLWALFNTRSSLTISESDIQKAIVAEGGKASEAVALWAQLDPKGESEVRALDFAFNPYLIDVVSAELPSLQTAVTEIQQKQGPDSSDNFLGAFSAFGGASDVGSGIGIFINVFV